MTVTRNNADILPWFLRHYETFCERMIFWDDQSTDGTRELLKAHPNCDMREWPFDTGLDDDAFLRFSYAAYRTAVGRADWVMLVDADEFIYHRGDMKEHLRNALSITTVCRTQGFNMAGQGVPTLLPGVQLYDLMPLGVHAPVYAKPVIFDPRMEIRWMRGKQELEFVDGAVHPTPLLKLLHYRYLGADYTRKRNAENFSRVGMFTGEKTAAWTCNPEYRGSDKEHSPEWAESINQLAFNVLNVPLEADWRTPRT